VLPGPVGNLCGSCRPDLKSREAAVVLFRFIMVEIGIGIGIEIRSTETVF
jgi:hypothetical protein